MIEVSLSFDTVYQNALNSLAQTFNSDGVESLRSESGIRAVCTRGLALLEGATSAAAGTAMSAMCSLMATISVSRIGSYRDRTSVVDVSYTARVGSQQRPTVQHHDK